MKYLPIIALFIYLTACNLQTRETKKVHAKIDSLEEALAATYKPGFGEFMSGIQVHHAKLWFAGLNQNWALADFELHEIQEAFEDIQQFCNDRSEARSISMIGPAMDSVTNSVNQKDLNRFKGSYILLTTACNSCHKATKHGFNVVTVPLNLPVPNQDFKPIK